MTIEVEREALLGALRQVAEVVEGRNTIPVLGNLLVQAADGTLTITGTNLDQQVSAAIQAAGTLETTINATKLVAAVTSLKPGTIVIAAVAGRAAVAQGQASA